MNYPDDNYHELVFRRQLDSDQEQYYDIRQRHRHFDSTEDFDLKRYYDQRRVRERQIVQCEDVPYRGPRDRDVFGEVDPILVRERDLVRYQRDYGEQDHSVRRQGEYYFSGPEHRFQDPRMPYYPSTTHRGFLSSSGPRGGPSWQQPFRRNNPSRRRHHLDDIFLPNHDDEECPEQEEGFHSRHSNYRAPIRVEVKTTKPETITKDNSASASRTNEKLGDSKCQEKLVTSANPRLNIKDNIDISKQSEVNKLSVKDGTTASKSCTVTKKDNETRINENIKITIQQTGITGNKVLEKKCETKTNHFENISLPKVSETKSNNPISKDETSAKNIKKVTLHRNVSTTNKETFSVLDTKVKDGNQSEIKINAGKKMTSSCPPEQSTVIHSKIAKKHESLNKRNPLKIQESLKADSNSTNTGTKGNVTKTSSDKIEKDVPSQVQSQSKDVTVPEIMCRADNEINPKSASTKKKDAPVSLKNKSSKATIIRREIFKSKSKINKVKDKNYQTISDANTAESIKSTSNKTLVVQLSNNDFTNKNEETFLNCASGSATKIVEQKSNCTNDKNKKSRKIVHTRNDGRSENSRERLEEKLPEDKTLSSNTKSNKTKSNNSSQMQNNTPVISMSNKMDSQTEIDIVKELEALVSKPDDQTITANTHCELQTTKDSNNAFVNSAEVTEKITEGNLTQDTPTSLPSSPQAIKKDIAIKLICSPLSKSPPAANKHQQLLLQKSQLSTVDSSPLPRSPLTISSTMDKELRKNYCKSISKVLGTKTTNLAHPNSADNSAVSKPTGTLTSNSNLQKINIINSNNGSSTGPINTCTDVDGGNNPPILEDIFILEDALKNIDAAPEIIDISCSPSSKDQETKSNENVKDDIINICSTPKRSAINFDDVQIIEEECCTIEIIDDDDSSTTIIDDDYKKSTIKDDVIKIESPDDFERYSKSPSVEQSGEQNRPVEDFRNLDTRGSFLWTFHQRFDDPRIVDMDISQSPSPPDITAQPVRSDQQKETDRIIKDMDALWNEISDNTTKKTSNSAELKDITEINKVNQKENFLTNVKLSSKTISKALQVDKNAKDCKHKNSNSFAVKDREEKSNNCSTTPFRQDPVYDVQDTLSEKLLPFSKRVKITDRTAKSSNLLPSVNKYFQPTSVSGKNGHRNLFRRSSFSHYSNLNSFKTSLRKIKSLDDIVSVSKVNLSHPKAPVVKSITKKPKIVVDKKRCIENKAIVSEKSVSKNSLERKSSTEDSKSAPHVDYKDELLSLLSSSGYEDQIDDKINFLNKETTEKLDLTSNPISNKSIIAADDNLEDSLVQKKRKRVRRIVSSDEESTDVTSKIIDNHKKPKIKEKTSRKRKISLDDKKKKKEPKKDVEVHEDLPVNEKRSSTKAQLPSLPKRDLNISVPEIGSSAQSPTKYVTKAEYVKTFAKNKSLVPNISLSIEPIPKKQKIPKRRATFTCEADNEKILRKVVSGERCKQKFLDLFGSISDDEEELVRQPSKDLSNPSVDKDKQNSKTHVVPKAKASSDNGKPKKDKTDKKRKRPLISKPFIKDSESSDSDTSKSSKQSKKPKTSSNKDDDNYKRIKVPHESSINSKEKITHEKQIPQSKDKIPIIEASDKLNRQKSSEKNREANSYKDTKNKPNLDSRRASSSSTESRSRDDKYKKDKEKKHKERIDERKSRSQSKESDSSNKSDVEKRRRKSISKERKIVNESDKKEKNGDALKQKLKELTKVSSRNSNDPEVCLNVQLPVTESNQKNVNEPINKYNENLKLSDNMTDIKQISKKISNKIQIIHEITLLPKGTKGHADPLKRLQESYRRNSAPDVLSSSSETSLIIGEIEDLPLLYRASEGEENETFQICQNFTPPAIKYDKITKLITVDIECIDKVHISEPIKTHNDATTRIQKDDEDDVIEIRPDIPVIDLTEENVITNLERSPTLNDLLLEAKKEMEELVQDQGTITLYRSDEADSNQDNEVQAVAASISLVTAEASKIKNDEKLSVSSSEGGLEILNKNVSNNTSASLNNTPKEKLPDSAKEVIEKASPAASELFTNLVQNLDITNTSPTDNINLENVNRVSSTTGTPKPPAVLEGVVSLNNGNQEASISLQASNQEVSMSLEHENQQAISSILGIQQSNQCGRVNAVSRSDVQICTDQNLRNSMPVLKATALHDNTINKNLNIENRIQLEQSRIHFQPINITNQNPIKTISTKESFVHPTDSGNITEQENHTENQGSLNTAECQPTGITSERQVFNTTPSSGIIEGLVGSTRPEMTITEQGNLETRLSLVQSRMVQEDSFGQHRGLPQTLREYRPAQRTKVTGTFVPPPALVNINSTQRSPRKDQMTQTRIVSVQPTQIANPENNQLILRTRGNQVIDLTEDNGELSKTDKRLIVDIFTRHSFFLAHLCKAQNGYIEYLKQQRFCQNYFKAEIALFEEQKQARLLSQSLRLITELQNLNIRATQNLGETAYDIVEKITHHLLKRDMPKQVTRSMVFLLIAQLIKPQTELFTRIPLLKALIRLCNIVVGKMFSKFPVTMSAEQRNILTRQVHEYNRLFGNPTLSGNQLANSFAIGQPNNHITTDVSQSRNQAEHMRQNTSNSSTRHATLSIMPNSQDNQSRNISVQQPATNQSTANTVQSTPIVRFEQPHGPPRQSLLNSGGLLSVRGTSSRTPPNVTIVRGTTVQAGRLPGVNQSPIRPNSMDSPSFNVPIMRQHRFTTPRQPSSFAVPSSFHQSRNLVGLVNLVKRVQDLPGGANTNTLGCTPRYVNNYDIPNHSHVYSSLGLPRRQLNTQNIDLNSTSKNPGNNSISPPSVTSQVMTSTHSSQTNTNLIDNCPMLSRLLNDNNCTNQDNTVTVNLTPQQRRCLLQTPQINNSSSEPSVMQVLSKQQSNVVPQSPRQNILQSPKQNVGFQSPRHTQNIIYEKSPRPPPSYEESIAAGASSLTESSLPEALKKRSENLLNELLFTPDSEPLFAKPSSPINNNFRIKLPFTQPETTHSSIVCTTRANTLSHFNDENQNASFKSTTVPSTSAHPLLNNPLTASPQLNVQSNVGSPRFQSTTSQSPVTYSSSRPKEAVVLNQGLAALSSIGPVSAMLNSSPQQIQNSQMNTPSQNSYYQPVSNSNQLLVDGNNANGRKSPILFINDSAIMPKPPDNVPVVADQTAALPHRHSYSSSVNPALENSNQSKTPKNFILHITSKASKEPKTKNSKPKPKPKTKPKTKKTAGPIRRKKGSRSKIIETVDLLSSDDDTTLDTQSSTELEYDMVKQAEAQFQVEFSKISHVRIESVTVNPTEVTSQSSTRQATTVASVPESTPVTHNQVQTLDTAQSSTKEATVISSVPKSTSVTPNQIENLDTAQSNTRQVRIVAEVPAMHVQVLEPHNMEPQSSNIHDLTNISDGVHRRESTNDETNTSVEISQPSSSNAVHRRESTNDETNTSVEILQSSTSNEVHRRESTNDETNTSVEISQPSTSNGVHRRESTNDEEAVKIIDLTWIDDLDDQELQREMDFVFIKKEEPRDEYDQAQEPNNMVVSPADSGVSSPPNQSEEDTTVYTVNVQRLCICEATAEYNCSCGEAWYCGEECQIKDWESHQKMYHTTQKLADAEEEMMVNEREVQISSET